MVVAVPLKGFANWSGGIGFIRLILEGLVLDPTLEIVALIPRPTRLQRLRRVAGASYRCLQGMSRGKWHWSVSRPYRPEAVLAALSDHVPRISVRFHEDTPSGLVSALRTCGAAVAIPCFEPMPADCPVPWVGYIYDFQHRHLPENFSEAERLGRDEAFARMIEAAPVVICNSEAVRKDAERFHPGSALKTVALPFTPVPRPEWFELDPRQARERHGLPQSYFILCNQFWIHKDHPTAIRAFAAFLARSGRTDVGLVCTGGQDDYRAPGHLDALKALISSLDLGESVHLLGHVPKADQIALLRGALALLQPTLFEGGPGGGAVYDALALGVPALVSDIEVNLEIENPLCRFFAQGDPASLAARMEEVVAQEPARPAPEILLGQAEVAARNLGKALVSAVRMAQEHRGL